MWRKGVTYIFSLEYKRWWTGKAIPSLLVIASWDLDSYGGSIWTQPASAPRAPAARHVRVTETELFHCYVSGWMFCHNMESIVLRPCHGITVTDTRDTYTLTMWQRHFSLSDKEAEGNRMETAATRHLDPQKGCRAPEVTGKFVCS